ncbi:MAG: hypothetical protein IJ012_07165 [Clostridia bacterium]|nr:hypothetical protein [Clostridia bacterium]
MGNEFVNEGRAPDLSGLLNGLLSNPAALSTLSSLLGNMQKPPEGPSCREERCDPPPCADPCPKAPPLLPPVPPQKPRDDRADLLCSLRPYLSKERCDMLDALLRILELMALFRRRR